MQKNISQFLELRAQATMVKIHAKILIHTSLSPFYKTLTNFASSYAFLSLPFK